MNLYDIDNAIRNILENGFNGTIDEETGELIEEGPQDLEELQMARKDKLEGIALYIKNLEALAEDIKDEEKALADRRKAHEAKIERLKEYLTVSMTNAQETGLETARAKISFRKSEAVVVDEAKLDKAYFKATTTYKPALTEIKKAIKEGQEVAGAYIEERKKVRIK